MHEGRVLAGKYRLLNKLTAGGMGSVWRAEHVELGSPAAVKLLEATIAESAEAVARFKREAQSSATLRSTNIVQVFDFGVDGQTPYIAMELLRGQSLAERLREQRRLSPQETASILAQVARAAAWAHSRGIVHRDLKPGNIFLSEDANDIVVKLLDFGIAKPLHLDLTATPVTLAGSIMGTPQYMSPEQAAGKREVDHRTDIWSFAVIAYECLTGQHAFRAETLGGLVLAICTEPLPIPSKHAVVPEGFDEWFACAAHRDPDRRFGSITEAGEALLSVCGVDSTVSSRTLRYFSTERTEVLAPAAPATGKRLLANALDDDAATKRTLAHPMAIFRAKKLFVFLGLFGTGAVAATLLHWTNSHRQRGPTTAALPVIAQSNQPVRPSAAAVSRADESQRSKQDMASPRASVESGPVVSHSRKRALSARASILAPANPQPIPSSLPAPLSSMGARAASAAPTDAANCDPKVKNELGFCPRPGK
jgi:serine/threonine-protein kinase